MQDNFFSPAVDAVPPTHPFHLIGRFQRFGHTFLAHPAILADVILLRVLQYEIGD